MPATCATGALRVSCEQFSLASDILSNSNRDLFGSVLEPARAGSAYASLGELECAQRVADTPPAYADVAERVAATTASPGFYQWTAAYGHQPTTPTQPPAAAVVDVDVSPIQSTPTAPPTPTSAAVSPASTVQPTEEAERLHAELSAVEQLLGPEPQQPSCSMDVPTTTTTTAAPISFMYLQAVTRTQAPRLYSRVRRPSWISPPLRQHAAAPICLRLRSLRRLMLLLLAH